MKRDVYIILRHTKSDKILKNKVSSINLIKLKNYIIVRNALLAR